SGNDSTPAKAQEATQKTDISSAKEDCILTATTAKTDALQATYVANNANKTIAQSVIDELIKKNNTNVGSATIEVTSDGTVTISTAGYEVIGTVDENGTLTFGEVETNTPGIKLKVASSLTLTEGETKEVEIDFKKFTADDVTWTSNKTANATVTKNTTNMKKATIEAIAKTADNEKVTITITAGDYSAEINVTVIEEQLDKVSDKRVETTNATSFAALSTTEPTTLKDEVGNKVKVPQNFRIAQDSGDYVQDGVVIEDSNLNQFVWVPVGTIKKATDKTTNPKTTTNVTIQLGRYANFTASNGTYRAVQAQNASNKEYIPTASNQAALNTYYYEFKDDAESTARMNATYANTKAKELDKFVKSALTNGGYYIARYEAGIEGTTASTTNGTYSISGSNFSTNGLTAENLNDYKSKLTSKPGKGVWNKINQPNADTLCRNMYTSGVNSDLMNSYAWDTAIIFIQQCANSSYASTSGQSTDTTKPGTTGTNTLLATSEADKQCNIYDMAGNVREWTTESFDNSGNPCVFRGGYYGNTRTTSYRNYLSTADTSYNIGFRPLLYL
ncbi:MAG: SUMF1/EgtB/PvdO family nonheme iron enzyme, partial [Clostridia bacterium]|nr:SUMF1/EgtB/PvdO family nonheme iron enzyme [Clostridia bacterium]